MTSGNSKALITGASTGIGAAYADRFARRGYDLVLVARDKARLERVATSLRQQTGQNIDVWIADLTQDEDLQPVENLLRTDQRICLLINNAGAVQHGSFSGADTAELDRLVRLNVQAMTRLITAALPGFLYRENSSIINLGSTVALAPNVPFGVYGATKAYVLALSESLQAEFPPEQIYIQVVLPGATRTQIWERSGRDVNALKEAMEVDELVDAAMVGFDRREAVTIPSLGDEKLWDAFVASRKSMLPSLMQVHAADRYRSFGS